MFLAVSVSLLSLPPLPRDTRSLRHSRLMLLHGHECAGPAVIQYYILRGPNFSPAGFGGKQKSVFTLQKWEPKIWSKSKILLHRNCLLTVRKANSFWSLVIKWFFPTTPSDCGTGACARAGPWQSPPVPSLRQRLGRPPALCLPAGEPPSSYSGPAWKHAACLLEWVLSTHVCVIKLCFSVLWKTCCKR